MPDPSSEVPYHIIEASMMVESRSISSTKRDLNSCTSPFGDEDVVTCPVTTEIAVAWNEQLQIRARKLARGKFAYNEIDVQLLEANSNSPSEQLVVAEAVEVPVGRFVDEKFLDSCIQYRLRLNDNRHLRLTIFLVYAVPYGVTYGKDKLFEYHWVPVTRSQCQKGCSGPLLRGFQKFDKFQNHGEASSPDEYEREWKTTNKLHIAIDEARNHIRKCCGTNNFRLLMAAYTEDQVLLGSAVSTSIKMTGNNGLPRGPASFQLFCHTDKLPSNSLILQGHSPTTGNGSLTGPATQHDSATTGMVQAVFGCIRPPDAKITKALQVDVPTQNMKEPSESQAFSTSATELRDIISMQSKDSGSKQAEDLSCTAALPEFCSSDAEDKDPYVRRDHSLSVLCNRFFLHYAAKQGSIIELNAASDLLGVKKRRLYEVINVLEAVQVVQRRGKSEYLLHGHLKIQDALTALKAKAQDSCQASHGDSAAVETVLDRNAYFPVVKEESKTESSDMENEHPSSIPSLNVISKDPATMSTKSVAHESGVGELGSSSHASGLRQEKSLRALCKKFIQSFLIDESRPMSWNDILEYVLNVGVDMSNLRKGRRLYDIVNILTTINLLEKSKPKENFRFLGAKGVEEYLVNIAAAQESHQSPTLQEFGSRQHVTKSTASSSQRITPAKRSRELSSKKHVVSFMEDETKNHKVTEEDSSRETLTIRVPLQSIDEHSLMHSRQERSDMETANKLPLSPVKEHLSESIQDSDLVLSPQSQCSSFGDTKNLPVNVEVKYVRNLTPVKKARSILKLVPPTSWKKVDLGQSFEPMDWEVQKLDQTDGEVVNGEPEVKPEPQDPGIINEVANRRPAVATVKIEGRSENQSEDVEERCLSKEHQAVKFSEEGCLPEVVNCRSENNFEGSNSTVAQSGPCTFMSYPTLSGGLVYHPETSISSRIRPVMAVDQHGTQNYPLNYVQKKFPPEQLMQVQNPGSLAAYMEYPRELFQLYSGSSFPMSQSNTVLSSLPIHSLPLPPQRDFPLSISDAPVRNSFNHLSDFGESQNNQLGGKLGNNRKGTVMDQALGFVPYVSPWKKMTWGQDKEGDLKSSTSKEVFDGSKQIQEEEDVLCVLKLGTTKEETTLCQDKEDDLKSSTLNGVFDCSKRIQDEEDVLCTLKLGTTKEETTLCQGIEGNLKGDTSKGVHDSSKRIQEGDVSVILKLGTTMEETTVSRKGG